MAKTAKNLHGQLFGNRVKVNPQSVWKPKRGHEAEFGCEPWHHIAVIGTLGLIFVWDTRKVEDTTFVDSSDLNLLFHPVDSGEDLILDEPGDGPIHTAILAEQVEDDNDFEGGDADEY